MTVDEVSEEEVFDITDFKEFSIKLHNWQGNVVNLADYMENRKAKS